MTVIQHIATNPHKPFVARSSFGSEEEFCPESFKMIGHLGEEEDGRLQLVAMTWDFVAELP